MPFTDGSFVSQPVPNAAVPLPLNSASPGDSRSLPSAFVQVGGGSPDTGIVSSPAAGGTSSTIPASPLIPSADPSIVPSADVADNSSAPASPPLVDSSGTVVLTPNKPSPQLVGDQVVWTATASDSGDNPVYQFSVGAAGHPLQVVRDFSHQNTFTWSPMQEGSYSVQVMVKDGFGGSVTASTVVTDTVNSRVTGNTPVISPTANPLVALYSAPPTADATMHVNFRAAGNPDAPWASTDAKSVLPGLSTNFVVAGMLPNTTYEMVNVTSRGSSAVQYFTTGGLPAGLTFHQLTERQAPGPGSDLSQGLVFHQAINFATSAVNTLATDLLGRVVWYYDPVASGLNSPFATSLVPGGTILMFDAPASYGPILREVDLAGNTLRETNTDAVNAQLTARGQDTITAFHHDAQRLPNGKTVVLGNVERTVDLNGTPRVYDGDMVIVLDENFQVTWTWNAFDFLDVHRGPIGEQTDTDPVDWLHSNAVSWSPADANLVVSMRHQDWVIKIAYANGTGDGRVLWRLGKDGDFTLDSTDPYPWFSHQHNAHFIDNTTMVVFDNGNTRRADFPDSNSRGQVYTLNEQNHSASLRLNADLGNFSEAVGSAQGLPNGNFAFTSGFQGDSNNPFGQLIEVRPDGTAAYVLEMSSWEYRAYRMRNLYGATDSPAGTTTSLVSSSNPSGLSQAITFTATVSPVPPATGAPTGTVTFRDGTAVLGYAMLNSSGLATFTTTALAVGTHAVTANYDGDANFVASTSAGVNQVVNQAAASVALNNSPSTSLINQPVTFTATVSPTSGIAIPTGTLTFFSNGTAFGTAVLMNGSATLTSSALAGGTHVVTAAYSGDATYPAAVSLPQNQVVSPGGTTVSLTSSANPVAPGQPVTLTATVATGATMPFPPLGVVTFLDGTAPLGMPVALVNGTATFSTAALSAGVHSVSARYSGDSNFSASTSLPLILTVATPAATTTTLTSTGNPARSGRPVTFTATVTPGTGSASYRPGGTVTFFDGAAQLGQPVAVINGTAAFTTAALSPGVHIVTARYSGDSHFTPSSSQGLSQVIRAGQLFALGGSSNKVQVRRTADGSLVVEFAPYASSYTGAVTVAMGDVNGDGYEDLIVGSASGAAHVKVYDGKALAQGTFTAANAESHLLTQFLAYDSSFGVGVNVAAAYVNGTPNADIITGPTSGNPDVKVFNSDTIANGSFDAAHPDANLLARWFAFDLNHNLGATVAGGDVEGTGFADVVTGATAGNPHVKVYSGRAIHNRTFNPANPDASLVASFFPYTTGQGLGVNVAVGDVNGDHFADVITAPGASSPDVRVYDGKAIANGSFSSSSPDTHRLDQFFAFDPSSGTGVNLAAADFTGSGRASILTGASNGTPHYRLVDGLNSTGVLPPALNGIDAVLANFRGGLFVGA